MNSTDRSKEARDAFGKGDLEAAAKAHSSELINVSFAQEKHAGKGSQYIGDMVYGGLDGIITTFAVVSGVAGAQLGSHVVLILGLANLFADGFSMATGAYLSTKSEQEYYERERQREAWEVEHFPDGERGEMLAIYRNHGYTEQDANALLDIQTRNPERWVDAMMVDELKMLPDERKPLYGGLATFTAFAISGAVPLLAYLAGLFVQIPANAVFPIAVVLSAFALFGLGAAKVKITNRNPWRSGLEMLLVGGLAASVAFGIGLLLRGLGG